MNLPDVEIVSAIVHHAWMDGKRAAGVTSRRSESGEELMQPYADLSEPAKDLDRLTVAAVYAAIEAASVEVSGISIISAERQRQKDVEGWTPEHDDEHSLGEMASAAAAYAGQTFEPTKDPPRGWPWDRKWWKPKGGRIRVLAKAGALIAAEIDRLLRLEDDR